MPLKRPKAEKLPKPFRDIEADHPESDRFRIMHIQQELDRMPGVSWNQPRPGLIARFNALPSYKIWAMLPAIGMGALIAVALFNTAFSGGVRVPTIIWVEDWAATRTSEDAVEERRLALARLKAEIDHTLTVVEPKAATDEDAATHAAALKRYAAIVAREEQQREKEMAERAAAGQ